MGLWGEIGIIVAGSQNSDFAGKTDRLLLGVAANQAALAFQARLLDAQKRVASDLDQRRAANSRACSSQRSTAARRFATLSLLAFGHQRHPRLHCDVVAYGRGGNRQPPDCEYAGCELDEIREWGTSGMVHPEDGGGRPAYGTAGRRAHLPLPGPRGQVCSGIGQALCNDPNAARSSLAKTCGCSQAAK